MFYFFWEHEWQLQSTGPECAYMRGLRVLRNGALAGRLLLCLARPSFAGPPPELAPTGLITGV